MRRAEDYRPSGAATWVVCTGNIDMRSMFPDAPDEADSEVTEDGTACHWLAAETYNGIVHQEDTLAPNGRVLTEEMFYGVDMYLRAVAAWPNVVPVCEKSVRIDRILLGMSGTPDMWAYNPTTRTLHIADLKFGFRFVEVWENWQLICYACGLLDLLGLSWVDTRIEFTIVQPRARHREGPVRTWTVNANKLIPFIDTLHGAAKRATEYVPNPGCYDCPGRHICVAYQNSAMRACEISYSGGNTHELSPAALGKELAVLKDAEKKIKGRLSGLEVAAEHIIKRGGIVPGWTLAATWARETWREGTEIEIRTLAEKFYNNAPVCKPVKLITPNQARAFLPESIVAMYAHKPSTGAKLTKQDPLAARKAFGDTP
jgi:uncharacterized protein DUF2800